MTGPAKMRVKAFAADASQVRRARVVGIDAGAGKPALPDEQDQERPAHDVEVCHCSTPTPMISAHRVGPAPQPNAPSPTSRSPRPRSARTARQRPDRARKVRRTAIKGSLAPDLPDQGPRPGASRAASSVLAAVVRLSNRTIQCCEPDPRSIREGVSADPPTRTAPPDGSPRP